MTKPGPILIVVVVLVVALAIGGLFHLYNTGQQETRQQATATMDRGIALFREKKYIESLAKLQSIPDGAIQDWRLPYYTASAHVMLKDYQSSVAELEKALALNPQEPLILFEFGVVYYKLGKPGLSKGYFASIVEIDPTHEEAKGLMDIMAELERKQSGETPVDSSQKDGNRDNSH